MIVDLPPGMGLEGIALGTFRAPRGARRLAKIAVALTIVAGGITWYFVSRHPYRWHASTQIVLPLALALLALLGLAVRTATIAVARDGIRWGWSALGFSQSRDELRGVHVYRDGIALQSKRRAGATWFLAARDWERFEVLVRQVRRADLPITELDRAAPLRARLQSYGRFLDGLMMFAMAASIAVMLWAS